MRTNIFAKSTVICGLLCGGILPQWANAQSLWSMGYIGYGITPISSLDWSATTHIAFWSVHPNADGSVGFDGPNGPSTSQSDWATYAQPLISATHSHGQKILLSFTVGGDWVGATSSGNLSTFVSNISNLVNSYGFDGVDLDWETNVNQTQYHNLLSALRSSLGSKLLTATSVQPISFWVANASLLDKFGLQTYDDETFAGYTWFNSALFSDNKNCTSGFQASVDWYASCFIAGGFPASKIMVGLDFQGYVMNGTTAPRQSLSGVTESQFNYRNLVSSYNLSSPTFDSQARVPWVPISNGYITFDNAQSLGEKVAYVKGHGLGGWIIWNLEADYISSGSTPAAQHPLAAAVAAALGTSYTAPSITSTSPLATATISTAYSVILAASGATPITWGITSGTLPSGLTLDSAGTISGTPTVTGTSTFTLQATNSFGNSSKSFSLAVAAAPPVISSFTASPSSLNAGSSSTLAWSTSGATVLSIDNGIGTVTGTTSTSVTPTSTTTYTLTATNAGGPVTKSVTVTVSIGGGPGTPQSAAWPGHAATDSDLLQAADRSSTTLAASLTNSGLSATLASSSTFVANQVALIDSEQVKICSLSGTTMTICSSGRGFAGTTATSHALGALVNGRVGAVYHNTLVQELIALETWLTTATHHGTYVGTASGGASWPNHVATTTELYQSADGASSTLASALSSGATTIPLASGSTFIAHQIGLIDSELFQVGTISSSTISGATRGIGGTTAASHATGASVLGVIATLNHNRLALELAHLESDLYANAGSTQIGICGMSCPIPTSGASWPNHAVTTTELLNATAGSAIVADYHNRLVLEVEALEADIAAHP